MEFEKPSQPATDIFVRFIGDYLRAQIDAVNQKRVQDLSGKQLTIDEIRNAGLSIQGMDNIQNEAIQEFSKAVNDLEKRIEVNLGFKLPKADDLAQSILEGRYFKDPSPTLLPTRQISGTDDIEDWEDIPLAPLRSRRRSLFVIPDPFIDEGPFPENDIEIDENDLLGKVEFNSVTEVNNYYVQWLEMTDSELRKYQEWIEQASQSGGFGQLVISEGEDSSKVKQKLRQAGLSLNRKIGWRGRDQTIFKVSQPNSNLTFENVERFEKVLGNVNNFEVSDSKLFDTDITKLDVTAKVTQCLKRANFRLIKHILGCYSQDLMGVRNLGVVSLGYLIDSLIIFGITPKKPLTQSNSDS